MQGNELKKFLTIAMHLSEKNGQKILTPPPIPPTPSVLNESNMNIIEQEKISTIKQLAFDKLVNFNIIDKFCSWF